MPGRGAPPVSTPLMRYRQGNFVQLPSDDWVDTEPSTYLRNF